MLISRTTTTDLIVSSKIKFVSQPHDILYFYFIWCYLIPTSPPPPPSNTLPSPAFMRVKNANDCKRSIFLEGGGGGGEAEEGADGRALVIINRSESPYSCYLI